MEMSRINTAPRASVTALLPAYTTTFTCEPNRTLPRGGVLSTIKRTGKRCGSRTQPVAFLIVCRPVLGSTLFWEPPQPMLSTWALKTAPGNESNTNSARSDADMYSRLFSLNIPETQTVLKSMKVSARPPLRLKRLLQLGIGSTLGAKLFPRLDKVGLAGAQHRPCCIQCGA